jgi:hypothetical protein
VNHGNLINLDGTAVRIFGGRNVTWAKIGADGVWIDSAGSPKDFPTVLAGCPFDGSLLPPCLVPEGRTVPCHQGLAFRGHCPQWITPAEKGWMPAELLIGALRGIGGIRELPRFAGHANARSRLSSTRRPAM